MPAELEAARDRLIFALDVDEPDEALDIARELQGQLRWIKVATRLYTRSGAPLLRSLSGMGFSLFLDLKFHDIPDQVEGACRSAATLGASPMTVHASGGRAMLEAAVRGANEGASAAGLERPRVLAVTVLTSLDGSDLSEMGIERSTEDQVLSLARLSRSAGCGGIVASPQELPLLRPALPPSFGTAGAQTPLYPRSRTADWTPPSLW